MENEQDFEDYYIEVDWRSGGQITAHFAYNCWIQDLSIYECIDSFYDN